MRICFDRLCFARQRPAPSDNTANDASITNHNHTSQNNVNKSPTTTATTSVITTTPSYTTTATIATTTNRNPATIELQTIPTATIFTNNHRSVGSLGPTDGGSINALDPPAANNRNGSKQQALEATTATTNNHRHSPLHRESLNNSLRLQKQKTPATRTTSSPPPTSFINILEKDSFEKAEIFPQDKKQQIQQTPDATSESNSKVATTTAPAAAAATDENKNKQQQIDKVETVNNQDHDEDDDAIALRHNPNDDHRQESVVVNLNGEEDLAKMQQEPNANIQFQPDLGLVNNNNLPALSGTLIDNTTGAIRLSLPLHTADVLTHTLIYGTVPTGAQQYNTDPNLQTRNILHQQELQLQQRYQQLQQLQAQTQGLFASSPTGAPIVLQPTGAGQQAIYPTADYCAQQKYNLAAQMQGLCISNQNNTPPSSAIMDPTAGGVNLLSNSYVPASAQEERLIQIIHAKDLKIQEMQRALQYKDTEIAELKSHLDKFQSVFPFSRSGATTPCGGVASGGAGASGGAVGGASGGSGGARKSGQSFQRQRAQGISAEPQSESSVLLANVTFPKYDKDDK